MDEERLRVEPLQMLPLFIIVKIVGVILTTTLVVAGKDGHPVFVMISAYVPAEPETALGILGLWLVLTVLKPGPDQLYAAAPEGPVNTIVFPLQTGLLLVIIGVEGV